MNRNMMYHTSKLEIRFLTHPPKRSTHKRSPPPQAAQAQASQIRSSFNAPLHRVNARKTDLFAGLRFPAGIQFNRNQKA